MSQNELDFELEQYFSTVEANRERERRAIDKLGNASKEFRRLEEEFKERTSLNRLDTSILFLAIGFQLVKRYILLPRFQGATPERVSHDDPAIKAALARKAQVYLQKNEKTPVVSGRFPSWKDIVIGNHGVSYDKTAGSRGLENMKGALHRVKTPAHDPSVLGWLFGVSNILGSTISVFSETGDLQGEKKFLSLLNIRSFKVERSRWSYPVATLTLDREVESVFGNALLSLEEDIRRLPAAVFAHGNHLYSDRYTLYGLPCPLLGFVDADAAFSVYKAGFDYEEFRLILKNNTMSVILSKLIDGLIELIHRLFYNPEDDLSLFRVRTRKIIVYSNLISTTSEVIRSAVILSQGEQAAWRQIDFGGVFYTISRLIKDVSFIARIKKEFILNEWQNSLLVKNNQII